MEARILVVEDDPAIATGLLDALMFEGLQAERAGNGAEAFSKTTKVRYDCIILDVMLPDMHGFEICKKLRQEHPELGIIMLTARSLEADKIRGLQAGADDYVTKPFSVGELVARIRALLRRSSTQKSPLLQTTVGGSDVDLNEQTITRSGKKSRLTFHESEVLRILITNRGNVVTRELLMREVWGNENSSTRSLDNVVAKLRRLLEKDSSSPEIILTAYGVGYKMVEAVGDSAASNS